MLPLLIIQHGLGLYYRLHLALVRMTKTLSVTETNSGNANYDSSFGGSDFAVTSSGRAVTNKGVKWLTAYTSLSKKQQLILEQSILEELTTQLRFILLVIA